MKNRPSGRTTCDGVFIDRDFKIDSRIDEMSSRAGALRVFKKAELVFSFIYIEINMFGAFN